MRGMYRSWVSFEVEVCDEVNMLQKRAVVFGIFNLGETETRIDRTASPTTVENMQRSYYVYRKTELYMLK
jgi:hypothetical protein